MIRRCSWSIEVVGVQNPILNAGQIEAQLGQTSDFMISVSQEQTDASQVNVQFVVKLVSQPGMQSYNLYAIIAEKKINYNAPNGENVHHEVFRKVLLNQAVSLSDVGDSVIINTNYDIDGAWKDEELRDICWEMDEMLEASGLEVLSYNSRLNRYRVRLTPEGDQDWPALAQLLKQSLEEQP